MIAPLLAAADADAARAALAEFTVEAVEELIGWPGRAAYSRGDLAGVARQARGAGDTPTATLIRLFLLGEAVEEPAASRALHPLPLERAAGLVEVSAGSARARYEVRPYGEAGAPDRWLVVSDFGSDVRAGPLAHDHVLGVGSASTTLAQATPRLPVGRALDLGTGCGVQALHLSQHAGSVTATDTSARALGCAATTAALSGLEWQLRRGSLLEPVAGERYDLVVANPPFVISPGSDGADDTYEYRDSGRPGDALCAELVRTVPKVLASGGCAQLLANWQIPVDGTPWAEQVGGWLDGTGCDAWVWQREVADLGEYVTLWLRDAGLAPGTADWARRYDAWLDWFAAAGVAAVGMGLLTLWRPPAAGSGGERVRLFEDVPQALQPPIGAEFPAWIERHRRLAALDDRALLGLTLRADDGLVRTRDDLLTPDHPRTTDDRPGAANGPGGGMRWSTAAARLRQSHGMRWEVEVDDAIAGVVAACDGRAPLGGVLALLAASLGAAEDAVADAALPVVRDLIGRGMLDLPGQAQP